MKGGGRDNKEDLVVFLAVLNRWLIQLRAHGSAVRFAITSTYKFNCTSLPTIFCDKASEAVCAQHWPDAEQCCPGSVHAAAAVPASSSHVLTLPRPTGPVLSPVDLLSRRRDQLLSPESCSSPF